MYFGAVISFRLKRVGIFSGLNAEKINFYGRKFTFLCERQQGCPTCQFAKHNEEILDAMVYCETEDCVYSYYGNAEPKH